MLVPYCRTKRQKNHCFNMVRLRKISLAESRGSSRPSLQFLFIVEVLCNTTWTGIDCLRIAIFASNIVLRKVSTLNISKIDKAYVFDTRYQAQNSCSGQIFCTLSTVKLILMVTPPTRWSKFQTEPWKRTKIPTS